MQTPITVALGSAEIPAASGAPLASLAVVPSDPVLADQRIVLICPTDATGSQAYNLALSDGAAAVEAYLAGPSIDPTRLATVGCGEAALPTPGIPAAEIDRRVEIVNPGRGR